MILFNDFCCRKLSKTLTLIAYWWCFLINCRGRRHFVLGALKKATKKSLPVIKEIPESSLMMLVMEFLLNFTLDRTWKKFLHKYFRKKALFREQIMELKRYWHFSPLLTRPHDNEQRKYLSLFCSRAQMNFWSFSLWRERAENCKMIFFFISNESGQQKLFFVIIFLYKL